MDANQIRTGAIAFLCHAHAGYWRRFAERARTSRPRKPFDDANLHAHHAGAVEESLRQGAPTGVAAR